MVQPIKQAAKAITTTASVANAPEVEDQADKTSVDDQLGEARYHTVLTQEDWNTLFNRLSTEKRFAFDTETTSLDYRVAEL